MQNNILQEMEPTLQSKPETWTGFADILLVEDNPSDAEMTMRALAGCGFAPRIEHVSDGAEALQYIASANLFAQKGAGSTPKLILLDLKLSGLGGLHVLRGLKADERTRGIPIVALTSSKIGIDLAESYKLGVNSYVIKPADPFQFAEVIAAIGRYWLGINELPSL